MSDMKMSRRSFLKGALGCASMLALSGCGTTNVVVDESKITGGTLNWHLTSPKSIDPAFAIENQGLQVVYQIYDALCVYDFKKKSVIGCAASKWEISDDADEFIFHLDEDAVFHNLESVTSQSFKRSWERLANPQTSSPLAYHLNMVEGYDEFRDGTTQEIEGITCPDDYTLKVTLKYPYPDFIYLVTQAFMVPLPKDIDDNAIGKNPIGNGPFKFSGWKDNIIELNKFEDYLMPAQIDCVKFYIEDDIDIAFKEFLAGNLDCVTIPNKDIEQAPQEYGLSADGYTIKPGQQCIFGNKSATNFLSLNNDDDLLADEKLRQAISLSIDRQKICDEIYMQKAQVADNIIPSCINGYEKDGWKYSYYDKDAALALLDEIYPLEHDSRGIKLELLDCDGAGHTDLMGYIKHDLESVGIDCSIKTLARQDYLKAVAQGDYQITRLTWNSDMPLIDNFLYPLFTSDSDANYAHYNDEEITLKLSDARQILKESSRISEYKDISRLISEACPVVPLTFSSLVKVGSKAIRCCVVDPDGICNMARVELNV